MLPPIETLAVYLAAAVTLILAPGPDTVYVISRGASRGGHTGRVAALGIATGVLVHTVMVALGLAALLRTAPWTFTLVKLVGAAYLAILGLDTLSHRGTAIEPTTKPHGQDAFRRGVTVNVLNPKVALFFLAFLPGFAPDGSTGTMLALGGIYALLTALYLGTVGSVSGAAAATLQSARVTTWLDTAAGVALLALAALLATGTA